MYAVIFRAVVKKQDEEYSRTAEKMRQLAFEKHNCQGFTAVTEGSQEIAISYWESLTDIQNWREDIEHQNAQRLGKKKWYHSYQVEIAEIKRQYKSRD